MSGRTLVRATASAVHALGLSPWLARAAGHARRHPAFPILVYHRVNDDRDPFFEATPTAVFARHVGHLARAYRVLTVEELVERMGRGDVPRNAAALTFDDGYRDNLTHAAPILARLGVPATIFLTTGFIGRVEAPWYDRLALAFKHTRRASVRTGDQTWELDGVARRLAALAAALDRLKRLGDDERRHALEGLLASLDVTEPVGLKEAMLTWDDVHALCGLGFSVGAHTVSHPILSQVSPAAAWREIEGSRAAIEAATGRRPRAFAYPNGGLEDYTDAVAQMVRRAGFTCAATTRFGVNTSATSPWELRRATAWEQHLPTFAFKLAWYRLRH